MKSDAFVGRERELRHLDALLAAGVRVIAITGTPGVGKTRLARELVRPPRSSLGFCDVTHARSEEDVCAAVARVLGIDLADATMGSAMTLGKVIAARSRSSGASGTVIVLDGAEHLVRTATPVLSDWLVCADGLRFVVTSREPLGMKGEAVCELAPLEPPHPGSEPGASPAVRLFLDRSARPLDDAEIAIVGDVVRRLDGIPLAIELAAARTGELGPAEILLELESHGLDLLGAGARGGQNALRAAIQSSWRLLGEAERRALRACTVFQGGFTTDAANAVLGPDAASIDGLRRKSLIGAEDAAQGSEPRFALYDSVRDYVLRDAGRSELADAAARHADYFVRLGTALAERCRARGGIVAQTRLTHEHDNLIAVVDRALAAEPSASAVKPALEVLLALEPLYVARLPLEAYGGRVDAVLDRAAGVGGVGAGLIARVVLLRAHIRNHGGRLELAAADCEHARSLAETHGEDGTAAWALAALGVIQSNRGLFTEAEVTYRRGLDLARRAGDRRAQARIVGGLAFVLRSASNRAGEALRLAEEAAQMARDVGDAVLEAKLETQVAAFHADRGATEDARSHYEAALHLAESLGLKSIETIVASNLAVLTHDDGRDALAAHDAYVHVLDAARAIGFTLLEGQVLVCSALALHELGRLDDAASAYDVALDSLRSAGDGPYTGLALAARGAVWAALGRASAAASSFDQADTMLEPLRDQGMLAAAEVLRGHFDLARADEALAQGDAEMSDRLCGAAAERVKRARTPGEGGHSLAARYGIVRVALATLKSELHRRSQSSVLVVASDGSWFRPPSGDRVELPRAGASRSVLAALTKGSLESCGAALSVEMLIAAIWPGIAPSVGRNRVAVAVTRLRKRGLRRILLSRSDGWLLDPSVRVVRVDSSLRR